MNKKLFILLILPGMVLASCSGNREQRKMAGQIKELEAGLYADTAAPVDNSRGMEMIRAYTAYADAYPDDTASAEYLYKGAEIAMNLKMSGMAIEYYKRIQGAYPGWSKVPYCLFLQAFILENQLQQYDQARALYERFAAGYPDHPLADDARMSVQNMGIPLEELIKSWEQKKQE
jgi:outer membrane protein assembly factor BamD (BamD/ComL family)